ncbi:hypothetical protein NH44784_051891 [Achromobacter xylosoxidans NH44784-1996]|nr:hypothetical protein NH44784_051891 [Achromobacter xylosoxidans NH44784-1996]
MAHAVLRVGRCQDGIRRPSLAPRRARIERDDVKRGSILGFSIN